jgi:hypothetical protein
MTLVSTGSSAALTVDYRYIFTDTLTDTVIAELPLTDVSFTSKLNEAGTFEGSLPITENSSVADVYNNTLPGKTSLYVLRNQTCVWGGIVSRRSYDVKEKILDISADEFVSYLDRRVVWKTWSTEFACRIEIRDVDEDPEVKRIIGKVELLGSDSLQQYNLIPGKSKVWLTFGSDLAQYAGQYTVLNDPVYGVDTVNYKFFHFAGFYRPATSVNFRPMKEGNISEEIASVRFRQETDDYLSGLLTEHFADDLKDLDFANEFVAPADFQRFEVDSYSRANNIATIVTTDKNFFVPGQIIAVRDLSGFNTSRSRVLSVSNDLKTFTYPYTGSNVSNTVASPTPYTITHYQRVDDIVTITTATDHGFEVGDIVRIDDLDNGIDSNVDYYVTRIGTSSGPNLRVFQFSSPGRTIRFSKAAANSVAIKLPIVEALTAGSFIDNSNIGISFNPSADLRTTQAYQDPIRGAELFTFKEVIDKYSSDLIGFDYRVDCTFDLATSTFSKEFKFLPISPLSVDLAIAALPGGVLPDNKLPEIEYFSIEGRNARSFSFEFPGNIEAVDFTETVEEGATRVFAQGKTDVDAPPPYGAAADFEFLKSGWPLFDKVIKKDKVFYSSDLSKIAKKVMSQAQMPVATFSITVNGTLDPEVGSYKPGDWCIVRIDDPFVQQRLRSYYENKGDSTRNVLLRKISGISVQLSANPTLPEEVTLELVTEPGIDITGAERQWR